uniref:Ig-like domain-containing protein n=1 Tax=Neogobius melanostomus TaxID=47308 RepID=A0A8C6U034_9GOBI
MAAPLRVLCALTCCFLLQTHHCTGKYKGQSLWSPRAVVASVGDDVVLQCLFRPPRDVSGQTLQWTRPDLDPMFLFVWRSYEELTVLRNPAFEGRATLFTDELKHGNISLKLTSVGVSDDGTYRCSVPGLGIDSTVRTASWTCLPWETLPGSPMVGSFRIIQAQTPPPH